MADKKSFILYTEYREQINMLTDEQAGQLMKAIFDYEAGEAVNLTDPVVLMLWSMMKRWLDINNEKYEKKQKASQTNGKKGGRPPKEKSEGLKPENEKTQQNPVGFSDNLKNLDNDNDYVNDNVNVNGNENIMSSSSDDYEDINKSACGRRCEDEEPIIPFGKDAFPTTAAEIEQFTALTDRLCMEYKQKPSSKTDLQKVFDYTHIRMELPSGEAIAAYDQQKAALLEYAFEQAAAAEKVSWRYIDGIYKNWERDGIDTVEKYLQHEYARNRRKEGISDNDDVENILNMLNNF